MTPPEKPSFHSLVTFILFVIVIYLVITNHTQTQYIEDIVNKTYDLRTYVSDIDDKLDNTANQQKDIIRDLYLDKIQEAIRIAHIAGFNHQQFVSVTGYNKIDTVRLKASNGSPDIEVNINTRVITIK